MHWHLIGAISPDGDEEKGDQKQLLDNVALLDSMESTLGTKPADSREGKDGAMSVIPETGREDQAETARTKTETAR